MDVEEEDDGLDGSLLVLMLNGDNVKVVTMRVGAGTVFLGCIQKILFNYTS